MMKFRGKNLWVRVCSLRSIEVSKLKILEIKSMVMIVILEIKRI